MALNPAAERRSPPLVCGSLLDKVQFALDPINYLLKYGTRDDVTRMQLPVYGVGTTEYVVVADPELATDVLTDSATFEQYSDIRHAMPIQNPLSTPQDDDIDWMTKRDAYVDAFTGDSYRKVIAAAEEQVADDVADLTTDRWYDTGTLMRRLTMRMMCRVLFDQTPPDEVERAIETAADNGLKVTNLGITSFLPVWTPRASLVGFWLNRDPISDWVTDAIESAPEHALIWDIADSLVDAAELEGAAELDDAIDRADARELYDANASVIDDDRLAGIALFPVVAGFVSPEVMLSACLDCLGTHPEENTNLEDAVADLPSRPTNSSLVDCRESLRWPLFESLRLYPPTYFVTRRATVPTSLGDYHISRNDFLWIDQWSLGRHPNHWDDPHAFDPGRWANLSPRRDAFLPYGAGERDCLGKNVSLLQGELVLANVFRQYDVEIDPVGLSPDDVRGGMSLSFDTPRLKVTE